MIVFKFLFLSEMGATFEFNLCYENKILRNCLNIQKMIKNAIRNFATLLAPFSGNYYQNLLTSDIFLLTNTE